MPSKNRKNNRFSAMEEEVDENPNIPEDAKNQMMRGAKSDLDLFFQVLSSGDNYNSNMSLYKSTGNLAESFADPLRETGFTRQKTVRETRLQAMTAPEDFSIAREGALKEVATNINNAYYTAYQQYADAGYPSIECKVKALSAAKIAKSQGEESIEARFGTLETKMADVKTIAKAQAENSGFDLAAR